MISLQQFISVESHFKIDHCLSKLLSVEVINNISKLLSNIRTWYQLFPIVQVVHLSENSARYDVILYLTVF